MMRGMRTALLLAAGLGLAVNGLAQSFLTNGLVAYYPFNGNANDASGSGRHGTILATAGVVPASDRFGKAVSAYAFDGNNSEGRAISVAPGLLNGGQSEFTVSLWWLTTDLTRSQAGILNTDPHPGFGLGIVPFSSTLCELGYHIGNGTHGWWSEWRTGGRYEANTWYHLVLLKQGTQYRLYMDGVNTDVFNLPESAGYDFAIGSILLGSPSPATFPHANFQGALDDVRIYNRALSSSEVAQLYAIEATPPPGFETNGLVAYYPFNGNANDESGNGNNGTVNGAIWTHDRFGLAGSACLFDGTNDHIVVPEASAFEQNSLTVSLWVNAARLAAEGQPRSDLIGKDDVDQRQWVLQLEASGRFRAAVFTSTEERTFDSVGVLATTTWYHLVHVWDGSKSSVYINGVFDSSIPASGSLRAGDTPVTIGASRASGNYLHGTLDDIRIYSRALSDREVSELYAYESGPHVALVKAVKPSFSNLWIGTNYQLQVSSDMSTWTNCGSPFTATNSIMVWPEYFDVLNWSSLYFRLR